MCSGESCSQKGGQICSFRWFFSHEQPLKNSRHHLGTERCTSMCFEFWYLRVHSIFQSERLRTRRNEEEAESAETLVLFCWSSVNVMSKIEAPGEHSRLTKRSWLNGCSPVRSARFFSCWAAHIRRSLCFVINLCFPINCISRCGTQSRKWPR